MEFNKVKVARTDAAISGTLKAISNLDGYIAGSAAMWAVAPDNEPIVKYGYGDIDVFASSRADVPTLKTLLSREFSRTVWEDHPNSMSTTTMASITGVERRINLIKSLAGDPETVVGSFDLDICMAYLTGDGGAYRVDVRKNDYEHLMSIINPNNGNTLTRVLKYTRRGYHLGFRSLENLKKAASKVGIPEELESMEGDMSLEACLLGYPEIVDQEIDDLLPF